MKSNNYAETILIATLGGIQQDIMNIVNGHVTVERIIKEHQYLNFDVKKSIDGLKQKESEILEALKIISNTGESL